MEIEQGGQMQEASMETNTQHLEGTVENIIFNNPENGYTVFSLAHDKTEETICVAFSESLNPGETVKVAGKFITHPSYGPQLQVDKLEKATPTTKKAIEKYLASGAVRGIGEKLAKTIVDEFGKDSLNVIEKHPEKLATIRGISLDKAKSISNIVAEQAELRRIVVALAEYDVSTTYAMKIYKRYKGHALDIVKENPYVLASDVIGIGFKTADAIARRFNIEPYSPYRIKAGLKYCLSQSVNNGDVCMEKEQLVRETTALLGVPREHIENAIVEMQIEKNLIQEKMPSETNDEPKIVVYQNFLFYAENYVAKKILELSKSTEARDPKGLKKTIDQTEKELGIALAKEQRLAVETAMQQGVLVITGGPGTGKTTIIKTIITLLQNENYSVELAAPTGRATKRMSEATGIEAKTIHRMLGINSGLGGGNAQSFEHDEDNPIEADVLIIDETSMVDLMLMYHLLKAVEHGTRLILVGDANQLPSVGAGNVLRDVIASEKLSVVRLQEIFRQAKQSHLVTNAHLINQGKYPVLNQKESDFFFMKRNTQNGVADTILDLCTNRLIGYMGIKQEDIQVLCPMRKSIVGAVSINERLQAGLNPPTNKKNQVQQGQNTFREGDKVMQIKNNYNMEWEVFEKGRVIDQGQGVFNGDEGIITEVNTTLEVVVVYFYDGKRVKYDYSQLEELSLSYAITIHKSQGSEYKAVIIPLHSGPPMLLNRNLLYTALTRAKILAVFVGLEETLYKMVDNNREIQRHSYLKHRIIKISKILDEEDDEMW